MKKEERTILTALIVIFFVLSCFGCSSQEQSPSTSVVDEKSPKESKVFQDVELPLPQTEEEKAYLGITGEGSFKISQIKTQVLLIEVLSNICPHCHKEAPQVNELYRAIERRPDLKGKIKIIGIGAGNDVSENSKFKELHKVPFPLFPDKDFSTSLGVLSIEATPTFIGVKIDAAGSHQSFYFKSGPFGEVPQFLANVLKLSGLEKEG